MNTEKLVLFETVEKGIYYNKNYCFSGTLEQAKQYAYEHNLGGGVEVFDRKKKKFVKVA